MTALAASIRGYADMARHVSLKGKVQAVALTDTGRVREHNEDSIAWDGDIGLFVLADGMGGYNAGEVASGIAVKTIMNLVREAFATQDLSGTDKSSGLSRPGIILRDAIARANKIIHQTSKTQEQCEGMGTTVVAGLLHDNRVIVAHVGDADQRAQCARVMIGGRATLRHVVSVEQQHGLVTEVIQRLVQSAVKIPPVAL